ncbi:hypothetical protein M8J75_011871 [Diaphorina citri]|nr:hypothetical protein M8J75_011871 [Diaphorina citri]
MPSDPFLSFPDALSYSIPLSCLILSDPALYFLPSYPALSCPAIPSSPILSSMMWGGRWTRRGFLLSPQF